MTGATTLLPVFSNCKVFWCKIVRSHPWRMIQLLHNKKSHVRVIGDCYTNSKCFLYHSGAGGQVYIFIYCFHEALIHWEEWIWLNEKKSKNSPKQVSWRKSFPPTFPVAFARILRNDVMLAPTLMSARWSSRWPPKLSKAIITLFSVASYKPKYWSSFKVKLQN